MDKEPSEWGPQWPAFQRHPLKLHSCSQTEAVPRFPADSKGIRLYKIADGWVGSRKACYSGADHLCGLGHGPCFIWASVPLSVLEPGVSSMILREDEEDQFDGHWAAEGLGF